MEELSDNKIQRLVEENTKQELTQDVRVYKTVFHELKKQPNLKIDDIAPAVLQIIITRNEWKYFFKSIVIGLIVCVLTSMVLFCVAANVDYKIVAHIAVLSKTFKWVCLFIIIAVFLLAVFDKKLMLDRYKKVGD